MVSHFPASRAPRQLAARGESPPWPFPTWATPENAEGFRDCRSPHPAAADYFHNLLTRICASSRQRKRIRRSSGRVQSQFIAAAS